MSVQDAITRGMLGEIISKISSLIMKSKRVPQLVEVIDKEYDLIKPLGERKAVTQQDYTDEFDITLSNPFDSELDVIGISLIPSTDFKTLGAAEIYVNDNKFFTIAAADFTDLDSLNLPLGNNKKKLQKGKDIGVKIKSSDGTSVALYVLAIIGKQLRNV